MGTPGTGPTRIAQYEVIGLLGRGGMGEVVEARDAQLGRHVAPPAPNRILVTLGAISNLHCASHTFNSGLHPN